MIRTTITTLTLTAATIIALATASPVLAASPSGEASLTPETTVEAPDATCTIDTDFGSIPCPVLDWSLGGLFDSVTGSDGPTVVGGIRFAVSTDQSSTPAASTFSTATLASSRADSRINNGPPANSIDDDAQSIIDLAQAGTSILSFDRMLIALLAVFGILGAVAIMIVLLIAFALGRRNG